MPPASASSRRCGQRRGETTRTRAPAASSASVLRAATRPPPTTTASLPLKWRKAGYGAGASGICLRQQPAVEVEEEYGHRDTAIDGGGAGACRAGADQLGEAAETRS